MTSKRTQDKCNSSQVPASEQVPVTPAQEDNEPAKKRRRRILSCDACRRLKTRCEIEYGSDTCSRCRNLRITCLKSDDLEKPSGSNETNANTQSDLVKSLHEKVMNLESSMQEMKTQLAKLQSQPQREPIQPRTEQQIILPAISSNDRVLVDQVEPADQHVHASPAEVIRRVACQVVGDYRRAFHTKEDVVSIGMLSAATADSLVKAQRERFGHERDFDPNLAISSCWSPSLTEWLVRSGFSDIIKRNSAGTSTMIDLRSIRLWANVCLVHLHWSATTGRPSILPGSYFSQCRTILNFEQTTIRDAMLLAEISLYCTLQKTVCGKPDFTSDGSCEKFTPWNHKWGYLLGLILNLSYWIANMILAKRSLDEIEALSLSVPTSASPQTPHGSTAQFQAIPTKDLQDRVYELSFQVTLAFVRIPSTSSGDLPEFHSLCVAYSMLILCQYDELPSSISHTELFSALNEVKRRCNESNSYSVAVEFSAERALDRLRADAHPLATAESIGQQAQFNGPPNQSHNAGINRSNVNINEAGLDNLDFFFNGGYLDILDIDNFLL
uniref:Zn(2)-C6 fungal-type domain-containing protein n=1 Tax=Gibberella zeae (strain ATCC MYA-4620 / CBS 123657 / FGSC 9075 / NRRL 31084 / PH-1) TaxID=229533 RepID=A0A098DTX4_GIBZE